MVNASQQCLVRETFSIPLHAGTNRPRTRRSRERVSRSCFGEFIGDSQNYLVPVAVDAVLHPSLGYEFNPIIFQGPSGTGKTFLARGLVHLWIAQHPQRKAMITSGTDLARDYANAVDTDSVSDFRRRLRSTALLLIDDVERMEKKVAAQEELVNTLDVLLDRGHQMLATLKQSPWETAGLIPALASRLSGGLTVPMSAPGPSARRLILDHLLAVHNLQLTNDAWELLLEPSPGFPRPPADFAALQQITLRLAMGVKKRGQLIDTEAVQAALAAREPAGEIPLKSIARSVSRHFHVRIPELKGPQRQQRVVRARGVAMLLARQLTGKSLADIGRHFGNRDHTTVLHACRKTEQRMASDPAIHRAVQELTSQLESP